MVEIDKMGFELCGVGGAPILWLSGLDPGSNIIGRAQMSNLASFRPPAITKAV